MTRKILFVFIICFTCVFEVKPQRPTSASASLALSMEDHQAYLVNIIEMMKESGKGRTRDSLNNRLGHELILAMSKDEKMEYSFDTLDLISKLRSEDAYLRVFTWELENENDEIKYYGVIQYTENGEHKLSRLSDSSNLEFEDAKFLEMSPRKWYGALYYDLKVFNYKGKRHAVLLGINRNSALTKKKVIEIVSVEEDILFGKEVFDIEKTGEIKRNIFEYSVDADMSIWFEEGKDDLIVMDHLSPLKPMYQDKAEYYVPDLSFDALEFKKGKWILIEDYDAKRGKRLNDRFYEMDLPEQKKVY